MTHWPKLVDALEMKLGDIKGATLNVHPEDTQDFVRSRWYADASPFRFRDLRILDNPLMLEGVAILVKDDTIQAVVNLEDGRSMETL